MELALATLYALCLSLPTAAMCSIFYVLAGLLLLRAGGLHEERSSLPGFVVMNLAAILGFATFLVLFAHFARTF